MKKYYEAYEERYKTIHQKGYSWSSDVATPIVSNTIKKYGINKDDSILDIGCGEGRDANSLLNDGYNLLAVDVSNEAIAYCKKLNPKNDNRFKVLDCLNDKIDEKYRFIYAIAVIHMLVLDEDRKKFYTFIKNHLSEDGIALICSMGDGNNEFKTDISEAFDIKKREHSSGPIEVVATSCKMVSFITFRKEINDAGLMIIEDGIASSFPDFNNLMYAVIRK